MTTARPLPRPIPHCDRTFIFVKHANCGEHSLSFEADCEVRGKFLWLLTVIQKLDHFPSVNLFTSYSQLFALDSVLGEGIALVT